MAHELILPLMGEGVVEAQIGRWLKAVGDSVSEGDPIVEVETDKVTTELESDFDGTILNILVPEGETAVLHQPLAIIGEAGESLDSGQYSVPTHQKTEHPTPQPTIQPPNHPTNQPAPVAVARNGEYNGRISPVVKRMVQEHNLDLSLIEGTGKNGRITKRDVTAYLEATPQTHPTAYPPNHLSTQPTIQPPNHLSTQPPTHQTPQPPNHQSPITNYQLPSTSDLLPHTPMRRKIAEHMVMSKRESPHATTVFEIDFTAVSKHRAAYKADFRTRGVKLTFMAYIATAVTQALQQVPKANSQWHDDGIVVHKTIHLGVATAVDNGLVVPVIKSADMLNLFGMAQAIEQMAQKGRMGKLKTDDLQGGTFTITNHGVFGSLFATPIINQPQSGILGVGAIEKRVCVVNDMIAIRPKAYFSFSFDHRILDGADSDRFMQIVKETIEGWTG